MKKISLFLFSIFFGIISVDAMSIKPTGDTTGIREKNINIYIALNRTIDEESVSGVDGTFSYDSNVLTLVSAESMLGNNWTQLSGISNNGTFSYANLMYNDLITSTSKNIVKVVFKVNSDAKSGNTTISVGNPNATDEEANGVNITGGDHIVKILSDENSLSNLTVGEEDIKFDSNKTTYDLTIDDTNVEIGAIVKDSSSKLSGDIGNKSLKYGVNTFKITVTSESGVSKVYTLNITRTDNRSSVNTLSNLKLSKGTIKFKVDTLKYDVDVENNVSSIKIDATLTDEKSSFVSGYGSRSVVLKEGKNTILIKVKAENESEKIYTINVTRKSNKSSNNYLSEIKLSNGNINFDRNKTDYSISVGYDVNEIEVDVKTDDSKSTYEILGNKNFKVGENTITIKVKAEDESVREYKIIVIRKEENQKLSSNSKLSSLKIDNYDIRFSSNVYEYNLKIKKEYSLDISYTTEDSNSKVYIVGNKELEDGSVINVLVTAEDGSESLYIINIEKGNNIGIVVVIIIVIILIGIVLFILFKKKKNDDGNNNQDNNIGNNDNNEVAIRNEFLDNNIVTDNNNFNNGINTFNNGVNNINYDNMYNNQNFNNGLNNLSSESSNVVKDSNNNLNNYM